MRFAVVLALATLLLYPADKKQRNQREAPEIEVIEIKAERAEGKILIDGIIRNCSTRTIQKVTLLFDLKASEGGTVTTQRGLVVETEFAPGEESEFYLQTKDPPRAVNFMVRAHDAGERELIVLKPGPYIIE